MKRSEREISDTHEIAEIIKKADVCRIALSDDNIPYIVTMNFGFSENPERLLYFHCAGTGKKLDIIRRNNYVCFEMDIDHIVYTGNRGCDWGMKYRSVVGYGNISIVTEKEERLTGLNCIMSHYGGENEYTYDEKVLNRTTILRLAIKEMTGKKC